MRSFLELMTCISCIVWIHSCDKRLLGVQLEKSRPLAPLYQLPQALPPIRIKPYNFFLIKTIAKADVKPGISSAPIKIKNVKPSQKQYDIKQADDALFFNLAMLGKPFIIANKNTP